MSSLSSRIAMLEDMLLKNGVQPPPAVHPPKSRHEAPMPPGMPYEQQKSLDELSIAPEVPSPPESGTEDCAVSLSKEQSSFCLPKPSVEDVIQRLLSTRGTLSFDQFAGRLRFFGSTSNPHPRHTEPADDPVYRETPEQVRRAERIIRSLTSPTYDYLMENFWTHYNSVLKVVHRETFESSRELQDTKFYSPFLHVSILAMGFRFADPDREDTRRIALGKRESSLHREAKRMLDVVLERPGGIPSVQALLLLGDLECGVGRDHTGWMYAGMAIRLAFDIGLHIDCRDDGIGEQEADNRRTVMRACVVYDRYWALFLGRPTSIKNQDIGIDLFSKEFSQLTSLTGLPGHRDTANDAAEAYNYLVELMGLAGCIPEAGNERQARDKRHIGGDEGENNAYIYAVDLYRHLQNWYTKLPEHLRWKPANIKQAPLGYFLLHQQYHVCMILLHRPWTRYAENGGDDTSNCPYSTTDPSSGPRKPLNQHLNHPPETRNPYIETWPGRTASSRGVCDFHATCVAKIFWQHRQRFDGTKIFITAVDHAATAAIALIAAMSYNQSGSDRQTYLGYLDILVSAIGDMGQAYEPAASMGSLLKVAFVQLQTTIGNTSSIFWPPVIPKGNKHGSLSTSGWRRSMNSVHLVIPVRREANAFDDQPYKRRRLSAPGLRASGIDRTNSKFLTEHYRTSPHKSSQSYFHVGGHPSFDPDAFATSGIDGPGSNLALFNGPNQELHEHSENKIKPSEGSSLVTTPSDSWPIDTLDESATPMSQQGDFGYDELMSQYDSGTSSIDFNSPLASHGIRRGTENVGLKNATASQRIIGDHMTQSDTESEAKNMSTSPVTEVFCHGGTSWSGGEGPFNTMCSVSLGELVQNSVADKVARDRKHGAPRNHELDFLSL
ncbi:fungal-specific transcription factor domain-containing protein [Colletotrichum cereale]|nr:fungal-specific transcription factor domain-containing protein [Colletotrichum cereale]